MLAALLLLSLSLQACTPGEEAQPALAFALDRSPFEGVPRPPTGEAFTILAGDADLDGDADLLVNWHVFAPPALLLNEGGRFTADPRGWSLPEQAAAPLLDGERWSMLERITQRAEPGIYLWHSDEASLWFVALVGPLPTTGPATLVLEFSRPVSRLQGRQASHYELRDERVLRVPLWSASGPQPGTGRHGPRKVVEHAFLRTADVGLQVKARIEGPSGGPVEGAVEGVPIPLFVGPELVRHEGPLELWGRDPHGVAWVDVAGSPLPDLVLVRGALRGLLQPPQDGKRDDLLVAEGGARPSYARRELPRNHARGRSVQWVDLEGDGRLELYVGNKASPNRLLAFDAELAQATDRATELGLALSGADAFAFLDLDGDGDEDLITLDAGSGLGCLASDGGRRFEALEAAALGLVLPRSDLVDGEQEPEEGGDGARGSSPGIDLHDLELLDFDRDGDLDLLVTGWGSAAAAHLFRAEGARFASAGAEAGLAGLAGVTQAIGTDLDADGWLDLVCLGPTLQVLRNERGRFARVAPGAGLRGASAPVGTACDADGDGRVDVVLASGELVLLRNQSELRGEWLRVDLAGPGRAPVGALLRARYADGTVQAVRAGSCQRGHLAQAFGEVWLASPRDNPLRELEARFPGGATVRQAITGPGPVRLAAPGK
ncbi:MAG TPA: VCBS repeat-containing protein [Planctomycetota bacterium]